MQFLAEADRSVFRTVRFVLTDMDETLTYQGRLAAQTYEALERLQGSPGPLLAERALNEWGVKT